MAYYLVVVLEENQEDRVQIMKLCNIFQVCTADVATYSKIEHTNLRSETCNAELKQLTTLGMGLEFGLMPDLRRKLVTKYTDKCYNVQTVEYSHCNSSDATLDRPSFKENCKSELQSVRRE